MNNYEWIKGQRVLNMGVNNYSHGMELLVFNAKTITPQEVAVLADNIWLNPTAKADSHDIFALRGTEEQFNSLFERQRESYAVQQAYRRLGHINFKVEELPEFINFKPWYADLAIEQIARLTAE